MNYNEMTDEELIQKLRQGEEDIANYIMEKYKGRVRQKAKAMYLLGGENDDLIQEGMIGLFKAVRDYNPDVGASFYSFAELCVSRQLYSAIKAAQRKKHSPLNWYVSIYEEKGSAENQIPLSETIEAGVGSNPEEAFLGKEYEETFDDQLKERLSKLENRIIYLHYMGMDYLTIAEIIEKPPKTVDNALQRIKAKAKKLIEELSEK